MRFAFAAAVLCLTACGPLSAEEQAELARLEPQVSVVRAAIDNNNPQPAPAPAPPRTSKPKPPPPRPTGPEGESVDDKHKGEIQLESW